MANNDPARDLAAGLPSEPQQAIRDATDRAGATPAGLRRDQSRRARHLSREDHRGTAPSTGDVLVGVDGSAADAVLNWSRKYPTVTTHQHATTGRPTDAIMLASTSA